MPGQLSEIRARVVDSTRAIRTLALLLLGLSPMSCVAGGVDSFIVVSDVDDTVKVTNVLDPHAAAINAVASELVFAGMPQLYQELLGANSSAERLEFVSGSPRVLLSHKVDECLNDARFPAHRLTLRDRLRSVYDFKIKHLQQMYQTSNNKFILVGDDTESDPKVYADFSSQKPNKVLAVYIHRITGRALPPGSIVFVTAYDIAMHEYKAGRLREEQAAVVGEAVLTSQDPAFLPNFQACPKEHMQNPDLPKPLEGLEERIEDRIARLCANRRPTPADRADG